MVSVEVKVCSEYSAMEEIDLQQPNNLDPSSVMNQENLLGQGLENLSVMDLQSKDQGLEVFVAARDGQISTLTDILDPLSEVVRRIILGKSYDEGEQSCSPLIIAARNGHRGVVTTLIQKYRVNLESEGTVKFDGHLIEG